MLGQWFWWIVKGPKTHPPAPTVSPAAGVIRCLVARSRISAERWSLLSGTNICSMFTGRTQSRFWFTSTGTLSEGTSLNKTTTNCFSERGSLLIHNMLPTNVPGPPHYNYMEGLPCPSLAWPHSRNTTTLNVCHCSPLNANHQHYYQYDIHYTTLFDIGLLIDMGSACVCACVFLEPTFNMIYMFRSRPTWILKLCRGRSARCVRKYVCKLKSFLSFFWKVSGDREEMYSKLEHDLISQVNHEGWNEWPSLAMFDFLDGLYTIVFFSIV